MTITNKNTEMIQLDFGLTPESLPFFTINQLIRMNQQFAGLTIK